jgi:GntR family transcriptional regulator
MRYALFCFRCGHAALCSITLESGFAIVPTGANELIADSANSHASHFATLGRSRSTRATGLFTRGHAVIPSQRTLLVAARAAPKGDVRRGRKPFDTSSTLVLCLIHLRGYHLMTRSAPVKFAKSIPKYFQIQSSLRERLRDKFRPGDVVPTEAALSREFGVSRVTIRQSLLTLAAEGLLDRGRGRRTRVTAGVLEAEGKKISGLLSDLLTGESGMTAEVLAVTDQAPDSEIAFRLNLAPTAKVIALDRLIRINGAPLAFLQTYLPAQLGAKILREDLAKIPVIAAIRRKSGVKVHSVSEAVEAVPADPRLAKLLGVELGAPLLKITRVYFSVEGWPFDYVKSFYRADRYRHLRTIVEAPEFAIPKAREKSNRGRQIVMT